jgi:hypothetical protein
MRTEHQTDLTMFCLTDPECSPNRKDVENVFTQSPDVTKTEDFKTPDNFTAPFPLLGTRDNSHLAEYTHTLMSLYAGFSAAWAVTCFIIIRKWKERAVGDSC